MLVFFSPSPFIICCLNNRCFVLIFVFCFCCCCCCVECALEDTDGVCARLWLFYNGITSTIVYCIFSSCTANRSILQFIIRAARFHLAQIRSFHQLGRVMLENIIVWLSQRTFSNNTMLCSAKETKKRNQMLSLSTDDWIACNVLQNFYSHRDYKTNENDEQSIHIDFDTLQINGTHRAYEATIFITITIASHNT